MTLAEEKALLQRFTKAAGAGEMLNILELEAAYQAAIGHATRPNQFIIGNHGSREEVIAIRQLACVNTNQQGNSKQPQQNGGSQNNNH